MEKFDRNAALEELMLILTNIQKTPGLVEQQIKYLTEVPRFLEAIYTIGKSDGIKIGERKKIEDITKQN